MRKATLIIMIAASLGVAACDNGETPKRPGEQDQLFKSQRQDLDRAKGVEDTVRQQAEQQRRQIDQATQ